MAWKKHEAATNCRFRIIWLLFMLTFHRSRKGCHFAWAHRMTHAVDMATTRGKRPKVLWFWTLEKTILFLQFSTGRLWWKKRMWLRWNQNEGYPLTTKTNIFSSMVTMKLGIGFLGFLGPFVLGTIQQKQINMGTKSNQLPPMIAFQVIVSDGTKHITHPESEDMHTFDLQVHISAISKNI